MKWTCGTQTWSLEDGPLVMGIVNATPDSFSDGYPSLKQAVAHAMNLVAAGADILDVGGESTRPGSQSVAEEEERRRVVPLIQELRRLADTPISIDTQKPVVARAALDEGACIVNHVSASLDYAAMLPVLAQYDAGYVAMHMRARPEHMQENPVYEDVLEEVTTALARVAQAAADHRIPAERLIFDPGIGFGKTLAHNLTLMRGLKQLASALHRPVLLGISRKSWLQHLFNDALPDISERDAYTALATVLLNQPVVLCHRVHQVSWLKRSLNLAKALNAPAD